MNARVWGSWALLVGVLALGGCSLYFGEDNDGGDDDCDAEIQELTLRNPQTGQCETFTNDPCAESGSTPLPNWGRCESDCETFGEQDCLRATGCRGVYAGDSYVDCWPVADQPDDARAGGCDGLNAEDCSLYDDCTAVHAAGDPTGAFSACAGEPGGCYFSRDCADGDYCTAADECLAHNCADCESPCYGYCAEDPDPDNFGECDGEVLCADEPPACPEGTQAGVRHGCYTGFCIPDSAC